MEHMNFNGLKHFPKNELIDYLQKAGVRFGSDLNAYTGFDQTVYQLPIPSDDPELLKNGLQVMRDWAQDALLDTDEINKERGVIMEEMRGGRGAMQRMRDQFLPVLLNQSLYAKRLPIGTEEVVTGFDPDVIRDFHKRWYRPDLQTLIIVGDVDVKEMEKEVVRLFSDMRVDENPAKREEVKIPLKNSNQFVVVTDPEMPSTVGQIIIKYPEEKTKTVGDYRYSLLQNVFRQAINGRLSELAQSTDSPYLQASVGFSSLFGGLDNMSAMFVAKPGEIEKGYKALVRELDRIQRFGVTHTEFDRAIAALQKNNETSYIERDKKKSDSYVQTYLSHFLDNAPALGDEDRYQLMKQLLPTLTLNEVNSIVRKYYVDNNRDIVILGPEKDKANLPQEAQVQAWSAEVDNETLTAYEDKTSELPLLATQPVKGTVVSKNEIAGIETKELILSNGVKVLLKPTNFKNDQILISASSPGGTSLYSDADYMSASNSAALVNSSGLGQLDAIELRKYLTGKNVNISPFVSERTEGVSGASDKEGLQTAFEMIYGYFTEPRLDEDIFQNIVSRTLSSFENRENDPQFVFSDQVARSLYGDNIRRVPATTEAVKSMDRVRALEIYKERFADASDFTFTIVGSFTEEEIRPYLEQYLAALPTLDRKDEAKDLGIVEPAKGFEKVVHKGKEEKVSVQLRYIGDYNYSETENLKFDALESVLSIKLIERLREEESGVYGVGARGSSNKYPTNRYSFMIGFGTGPSKYQALINSALDEVQKVKTNGPSQTDLDKFVIEQRRQLEINLRENGFWMNQISSAYRNEEDPTYILRYIDELEKLTVDDIKEVANKYLQDDRLFKFILLPEEVK
jgi:zinc protease